MVVFFGFKRLSREGWCHVDEEFDALNTFRQSVLIYHFSSFGNNNAIAGIDSSFRSENCTEPVFVDIGAEQTGCSDYGSQN